LWSGGHPRPASSQCVSKRSSAARAIRRGVPQTHTTVRHYKEAVDEQPPEIAQAEEAIQKNDFAGAETLLKKALEKDPNNYQAWFDLGFALNGLNRADESIAAYRKSVAAKPEVFESNLNLGLMLVRANNPERSNFCGRRRRSNPLRTSKRAKPARGLRWLTCWKRKNGRCIRGLPEGVRAEPKGSRAAYFRRLAARAAEGILRRRGRI